MNTFDQHEIRSQVQADGFGSWLLKRKQDGQWVGEFWCRITAADRYLRVSGDFEPIIFAYGPEDPRACVAWMGKEDHLTGYAVEKARIGSGRDACTSEDTDDAREDIRELIAEHRAQRDAYCLDDLEPLRRSSFELALQAGLDSVDEYSEGAGVFMILKAALDSPHDIESEDLIGIGARPSSALKLAHAAVRQLHVLLSRPVVTLDQSIVVVVDGGSSSGVQTAR